MNTIFTPKGMYKSTQELPELQGKYILEIKTYKDALRKVKTVATVSKLENGVKNHQVFVDYHEILAQSEPNRVIQKHLEDQHYKALGDIVALTDRVVRFYREG